MKMIIFEVKRWASANGILDFTDHRLGALDLWKHFGYVCVRKQQ